MSTESETKSAGVPAGATQQCAACGQYWNDADWPIPPFTDLKCRCDDVRPIAEAGPAPTTAETPALPQARACIHGAWNCQACLWANGRPAGELTAHYLAAPTTAAPAEQLSEEEAICGKTFNVEDPYDDLRVCHLPPGHKGECDNLGHRDDHDPAEQPGKAADPRPAHLTDSEIEKQHPTPPGELTRDEWRQVIPLGIDIVRKLSTLHLRTRPAQPQAPAEPTQEKIEKARKLAMKIFAFHNSGNADLGKETAWIEAYADHVAAPLREERDRLAGRLKALESRWKDASEQINAAKYMVEKARDCERAEKAVAARDARIATLENELRGVLRHVEREAEEHAQAAIKIRAALGAPEGQPRDYDPMTSPVPEGDMNGPHGPIPAPEGQPPVASSEAPLRLEVRRLAEAFGKAGSEYERGGNTSGAAQLRRVSNLLYALWADGKAEVFTPFTCAEPEAPLDALREALLNTKFETYCPDCEWTIRGGARVPMRTAKCSTCAPVRAALSAPPPPPREQELLGEEGGEA